MVGFFNLRYTLKLINYFRIIIYNTFFKNLNLKNIQTGYSK